MSPIPFQKALFLVGQETEYHERRFPLSEAHPHLLFSRYGLPLFQRPEFPAVSSSGATAGLVYEGDFPSRPDYVAIHESIHIR
jgi:hypothetical protein